MRQKKIFKLFIFLMTASVVTGGLWLSTVIIPVFSFFMPDRWNANPQNIRIAFAKNKLVVAGQADGEEIKLNYRFGTPIKLDLKSIDTFMVRMRLLRPDITEFRIQLLSHNDPDQNAEWPIGIQSERMGIDGTRLDKWQNYKLPILWAQDHNFDSSNITDLVIKYRLNEANDQPHLEMTAPKPLSRFSLPWPIFFNHPQVKPITFSYINNTRLPVFKLTIPDDSLQALFSDQPNSGLTSAPAKLTDDQKKSYSVKVRTRGDSPIHFDYFKRSWRIIFPDNQLYHGSIKRLNFIVPKQPLYGTILPYQISEYLELLAPQSFSARLAINGVDFGAYAAVEQIDDWFLKSRGRRRGILFFGDTEFGKSYDQPYLLFESPERWQITQIMNWNLETDGNPLEKLLKIVALPHQEFEKQIESILDVESYLRWYVIFQLFNSLHNDDWHNVKMFYNADRGKFEMIVWDVVPNLSVDPFPRFLVNNRLTLKLFQLDRFRILRDRLFLEYGAKFITSGKLKKDLENITKLTKKDFINDIFILPSDVNNYDRNSADFYLQIEKHVKEILRKIQNPNYDLCLLSNSKIKITLRSSMIIDVNGKTIATQLQETPMDNTLTAVGVLHRLQLTPQPTAYILPASSTLTHIANNLTIYSPPDFAELNVCTSN